MMRHDPLALYHAVMGKLWDDQNQNIRAAKQLAANRQLRSQVWSGNRQGATTGRASVRNLAKRAAGSRSAVFKRIRAGECKSKQSLRAQLDYINDKADYSFSTLTNALSESEVLTEGQKDSVVDKFADTWRGTTKLGFTSHMLLSFPTDASIEEVKTIALEWAEHFF